MRQRLSLQAAQIDSAGQANPDISENATLLRKAKIRLLLLFDELPEWAKDNEYIRSGWRPETNTY
ncbi:HlyIII-domain-containing protein [Metarhizium brunneum]